MAAEGRGSCAKASGDGFALMLLALRWVLLPLLAVVHYLGGGGEDRIRGRRVRCARSGVVIYCCQQVNFQVLVPQQNDF